MDEVKTKQDNIIYQLELILKTVKSIDHNIIKSIDLLDTTYNLQAIDTLVLYNTDKLVTVLQLLGSLDK